MSLRHGLEIRAATPQDTAGLAELLATPPLTLTTRLDALRASPGALLLALEWGPPSGLIAVTWHPTLTQNRPTALITTLLVAEDARRRGIARLLVKAASQAARAAGCETIHLETPTEDLAAFAAATGFTPGATHQTRSLRRTPS
jgi:GNAT superfamily N-acetyltransferase